ncbi:hypothetical protein BOX15_Mlig012204g2 [Macrostomum lignano]|uniref:Uncharacterized protein n=1 Tax=Macrostomum lignano TaxID=282301 RepID=A0A267GVN5_9PLAT|nr:hypothetical protein BOX15_Mlig012204g4 [Macrostomum lignano]PAA89407.1 hypothetical protein BOX15_Mlig012204g2 [Macrostomum lignano]
MQPAFACPLASQSRFCLSGPSVQRNCNATDLHLQDYCGDSQLPASEKDQRSSHFAARSERTAGTDGAGGGGGGRRVEFASESSVLRLPDFLHQKLHKRPPRGSYRILELFKQGLRPAANQGGAAAAAVS